MLENNQYEPKYIKYVGLKYPYSKKHFALFECNCGKTFKAQVSEVRNGKVKNCGNCKVFNDNKEFFTKDGYRVKYSYRSKLRIWLKAKKIGHVKSLVKITEWRNLSDYYRNSRLAKDIKKRYNLSNDDRYDLHKFLYFLRETVKIELKDINRVTKYTDMKTVEFRVVGDCPFKKETI